MHGLISGCPGNFLIPHYFEWHSLHQLESIIFFLVKLAVPSRKQSSLLVVSLHKSYRLQYYYQASIQASNWPLPSWVVNYGEIFVSLCILYMSLTISTCLVLYHCYWVIVKIVLKMELIREVQYPMTNW